MSSKSEESGLNEIKCIFFSEFDPEIGPLIRYQTPPDYVSKEQFDCIRNYVITKQDLHNRIINLRLLGLRVVGLPMSIDNRKYIRNALIFNLAFVFDEKFDGIAYEPIVEKMAYYLKKLESEEEFLYIKEKKSRLPDILKDMREELNKNGFCAVPLTESLTAHLSLGRTWDVPPEFEEHDVPIFYPDLEYLKCCERVDITTRQVMSLIDGRRYVTALASDSNIHKDIIKVCLKNLLHFKVITTVPMFQYSNTYVVTDQFNEIFKEDKKSECQRYVALIDTSLPSISDIFSILLAIKPGLTVKELYKRTHPESLGIDLFRLIQWAVMRKVIRRVHKYPVMKKTCTLGERKLIYDYCDGHYCSDKICCERQIDYSQLEAEIEEDELLVTICK
ncbi:DgyrCDS8284 [Dimorphilus gyrociliatus]|uniref:DgyrCDS8284 n=1 Tax=Dimorphilus gyrociliatus TaxID=2664684 RepID=A0A7I8VVX3_9ANNE|nr:DgyrCDS8284 [Dimorphilus gyrociliatus]